MSEDEPKKPIRRRCRRLGEKPATAPEPQEPKPRTRRRRLPPGVKSVPYWKVAGGGPLRLEGTEEED